jgi:hypothetical protein
LTERSPKTKKAPSVLSKSLSRCREETRVPARAVPRVPPCNGSLVSTGARLHDMKK